MESIHSIKSLKRTGSWSCDLRAELRMYGWTVDHDTFLNEEKVTVVVKVTSLKV